MFRPLHGHHQAFFDTSLQFAAYIVGIPTMFILKSRLTVSLLFQINILGIPTMCAANWRLVSKKAWWWPCKGRNM